jgi:hypothetical protein
MKQGSRQCNKAYTTPTLNTFAAAIGNAQALTRRVSTAVWRLTESCLSLADNKTKFSLDLEINAGFEIETQTISQTVILVTSSARAGLVNFYHSL